MIQQRFLVGKYFLCLVGAILSKLRIFPNRLSADVPARCERCCTDTVPSWLYLIAMGVCLCSLKSRFSISFDVFKYRAQFRKTERGPPDYYVVVAKSVKFQHQHIALWFSCWILNVGVQILLLFWQISTWSIRQLMVYPWNGPWLTQEMFHSTTSWTCSCLQLFQRDSKRALRNFAGIIFWLRLHANLKWNVVCVLSGKWILFGVTVTSV